MRPKQLVNGVFIMTLILNEIKLQEIRNGFSSFNMKDEEGNTENLAQQNTPEYTIDGLEVALL